MQAQGRTGDGGVGKRALALRRGNDVLLHGARHVQPQHQHRPRLAQPVRARLRLQVPPQMANELNFAT